MSTRIDWIEQNESDEMEYTFIGRRQSRRTGRHNMEKRPQTYKGQLPDEIIEQMQGEEDFLPSYAASHNENRMLQAQLTSFYQEHIITDVLAPVKGGKEASVYCCRAHSSTGLELIAAKIYRPRAFRSLRNDAVYKEGREALDAEGKAIRDTRRHRALAKKTRYGKEVDIGSWIEHEFATMKMLYEAGVDVPKPLARAGTTILMEYLGDVRSPAPALNGVALDASLAQPLFQRLLNNIELMLTHNCIHADFSAYNILFWQNTAFIIDFPQAVLATSNRNAFSFLQRDLTRLCQYFSGYGIEADPEALAADLWQRFMDGEL
ncbi:MAG: hypothetical protein J5I90_06850 [Caldilineales bacterium]|nr:hypothetical protein [Caldilineales bacterium]